MKRLLALLALTVPVTAADVIVSWDHPPDDPASIAGYEIFYGPNKQSSTNRVKVGYTNTVKIANLTNDTYSFTAFSKSTNGLYSLPSNELQVKLPRPSTPLNVTLKLIITIDTP